MDKSGCGQQDHYLACMADIEVVPVELEAVGVPLSQVGELLRVLAGDRRQLEQLGAGSPNALLRQALDAFIERWELTVWHVGGDAIDLGVDVNIAAVNYRYGEQSLERVFRTGPVAQ